MNLGLWTTQGVGPSNSTLGLSGTTAPGCLTNLGPDVGLDSIGDFEIAKPLSKLLDRLDMENQLAKTVLYNLNPRDNELMGTMIGNFQDGSVPGKMQYGSGWWFLDQKDGMEKTNECPFKLRFVEQVCWDVDRFKKLLVIHQA